MFFQIENDAFESLKNEDKEDMINKEIRDKYEKLLVYAETSNEPLGCPIINCNGKGNIHSGRNRHLW